MNSPRPGFPGSRCSSVAAEFEWPNEECRVAVLEYLDRKLRADEQSLTVDFPVPDGFALAPSTGGRMLSERDLAERFQCTPRTIRRWEEIGDLPPSVTFGGTKRWRAEDVDEWIDTRVREAERKLKGENSEEARSEGGVAPEVGGRP